MLRPVAKIEAFIYSVVKPKVQAPESERSHARLGWPLAFRRRRQGTLQSGFTIQFAKGEVMDKDAMRQFDIPADMRTMAEKSVEQARVAFNTFMTAAQEAMVALEGQTKATQAGAKDISEKAMSYAERNVANTFAFADRIVHASDAQEVIRLQTEFIQAQMKELAEQAKDLGESAAKMAMKSVPPGLKS